MQYLANLFAGLLLFVILNLFYRSAYAYPLTIYLIPLLLQKDKNDLDYSFYDFIKASIALLLYTVVLWLFNIIIGYVFAFVLSIFYPLNYWNLIIVISPNLIFYLYAIYCVTTKNLFSLLTKKEKMLNYCGMFLLFLERTTPQLIGFVIAIVQ